MINLQNVSKSYSKNIIFNNINITFPENKINFILGRNGAGKTTLYKCILELEKYTGDIAIDSNRIFCIYDNPPFYNDLNGFSNILLFKKMYNINENIDVDYSVLSFDLLKKKVSSYSYGERKKLALLLVDIINPDVILLDEVSNGLDFDTILYLKNKLKEWKSKMTIILSGHQLDFYNTIVENVYVMHNKGLISVPDSKDLEEVYHEYIK